MFSFIKNWWNEGQLISDNIPNKAIDIHLAFQKLREKNIKTPEIIEEPISENESEQTKIQNFYKYCVDQIGKEILKFVKNDRYNSFGLCCINFTDYNRYMNVKEIRNIKLTETFVEDLKNYIESDISFQNNIVVKVSFSTSIVTVKLMPKNDIVCFDMNIWFRIKDMIHFSDYSKIDTKNHLEFESNSRPKFKFKFGHTFEEYNNMLNRRT